jgi:hypothetical protein
LEVGFLSASELVFERVVAAIEAIEVKLHGLEKLFAYLCVDTVLHPDRVSHSLGRCCAIARLVYARGWDVG